MVFLDAERPPRFRWLREAAGLAIVAATLSCSGSLPRPPMIQVADTDYVEVSFPPRTPPVEFVPPSPVSNAVWVDGSWEWAGGRYGWRFGTWVVPPSGARRSRWVVVRRKEDGQLFFAPASWKDKAGKLIDDRDWIHALGPSARARSRPGAASQQYLPGRETIVPPPDDEED